MLDVPSDSQTDGYSCGAIAAWSIVETFRPRANFWNFYQEVSPDPGEGVGPTRVVAVLRKLKIGVGVRMKFGWKDIQRSIDVGYPMLVDTGFEFPELEGGHWSVLYGYERGSELSPANLIGMF